MSINETDLRLLGEILVQIRGIASDAAGLAHVSTMGRDHFMPHEALVAIYKLADAAHNLPEELAFAPGRLDESRRIVAAVGAEIFGDNSPFAIRS